MHAGIRLVGLFCLFCFIGAALRVQHPADCRDVKLLAAHNMVTSCSLHVHVSLITSVVIIIIITLKVSNSSCESLIITGTLLQHIDEEKHKILI